MPYSPLISTYDGRTVSTGAPSLTLNAPTNAGTSSSLTPVLTFTGVSSTLDQAMAYEVQLDTVNTFNSLQTGPTRAQAAVSGTQSTFASSVQSAAFANALTANSTILIAFAADAGATSANTPTDTAGNIYIRAPGGKFNASHIGADLEFWFANNTHTTASNKVTVTDNGGGVNSAVIMEEWLGLDPTNPFDQIAVTDSGASTGTALSSGATPTTTLANELVFTIGLTNNGANDMSLGTGFTNLTQTFTTSPMNLGIASKVVTSAGAQTGLMACSPAADWACMVVTLRQATAPLVDAHSATDVGFADITNGTHTSPFPDSEQVGYTIQSALTNGILYYWRVRTVESGNASVPQGWSSIFSFTAGSSGTMHTMSIGGTFSASGNLNRSTNRLLAGNYSDQGALLQKLTKKLLPAATFSTSGTLNRFLSRAFSATFSASGAFSKTHLIIQALSGMFSSSGILQKTTSKGLSATYSDSGLLNRSTSRLLAASFSSSGSLNRRLSRLLGAAYSDSGVLISSHLRLVGLAGTFSSSGSLNRVVRRALSAAFSSNGALNRRLSRALAATFSSSGIFSKRTNLPLGGNYSDSGTLSQAKKKALSATYSDSGQLNRSLSRKLTASFSSSGNLAKRLSRTFAGLYSDAANLSTHKITIILVNFSATFSASGNLNKRFSRSFGGTFLTRGFFATFKAAVYTPIKGFITTGVKAAIVQSGSKLSQVGSGGKLGNISTGNKDENINTGSKDSTISSGGMKGTL